MCVCERSRASIGTQPIDACGAVVAVLPWQVCEKGKLHWACALIALRACAWVTVPQVVGTQRCVCAWCVCGYTAILHSLGEVSDHRMDADVGEEGSSRMWLVRMVCVAVGRKDAYEFLGKTLPNTLLWYGGTRCHDDCCIFRFYGLCLC